MRITLTGLGALAAVAIAGCGSGAGTGTGTGTRSTHASHTAAATAGGPATSSAATQTQAAQTTATSSAAATSTAAHSTATAAPTGGAAVGGAAVGGAANPCKAAGLALSFLGGQGATGHGELGFALKNTGAGCATGGYPGIQFLSRDGAALPTTPQHTTSDFFGDLPLAPLSLAPGHTASFRLGVSHGGGSEAGCTTAYGLQVIPPNDTATLRVQIPDGASECGPTTVSPLQPGLSAYQ